MNREKRQDIERYIKERAKDYFQSDKSGKGYICPICGSGSGKNGTGITENPKSRGHFTCWAGCFQNADIFEIIGRQFNLTDFNDIFNKACEIFGITVENTSTFNTRPSLKPKTGEKPSQVSEIKDFTEFFKQAAANIEKTDYHRGISLATLKKFNVGYVEKWRVDEKVPYSPRLIIPNDSGGYLARDTRAEQEQYKKMRPTGYHVGLFNSAALNQTSKPVFVVEGEIDALSIIDAGGEAVALCSASNVNKLIEFIKERQEKGAEIPNLIIQPDNDKAGQGAGTKLINALKVLRFFSYRQLALPEAYKDANEFLMNDHKGFSSWIENEINTDFTAFEDENQKESDEAEAAIIEEFDRQSMAESLESFIERIRKNKKGGGISTGFENLDEALDGGFYPGLYVTGANSSIGKTTFTLQIADSIAQSGKGVLIFSLEMARWELTAKILSRMSFIKSIRKYGSKRFAKTTREVLLADYRNEEDKLIAEQSVQDFSDWGQRLYTFEGIGDIGVAQIKEEVEKYVRYKKDSPVVIIDYLQILAPFDMKMTDKQNTDRNITELKRLSRDFDIPVIGISSFNRESYKQPVSMASFKESGAIEYSSDVLLALQYNGWDYGDEDEKDWKRQQRIRAISRLMEQAARERGNQDIQLKILKSRNGIRKSLFFEFFPAFNYFRPRIEIDEE